MNVKVVALIAVVDEQPILSRAMDCGQVWSTFHVERGVELRELLRIRVLAHRCPQAGIVERDRRDRGRLFVPPFDSTLAQEIGHGDRFSRLVHHPEVLDVNAEQLATMLAEIPIVEPDQPYQVGIDPEVGGTGLITAVVACARRWGWGRRRDLAGRRRRGRRLADGREVPRSGRRRRH